MVFDLEWLRVLVPINFSIHSYKQSLASLFLRYEMNNYCARISSQNFEIMTGTAMNKQIVSRVIKTRSSLFECRDEIDVLHAHFTYVYNNILYICIRYSMDNYWTFGSH